MPFRTGLYLDEETRNGDASGLGGCGARDEKVSVNRYGEVLFGSVGSWPAAQIRLTSGGMDVTVNIIHGYFLTIGPGTGSYRLTLSGAGQEQLGVIDHLAPPGSAVPS